MGIYGSGVSFNAAHDFRYGKPFERRSQNRAVYLYNADTSWRVLQNNRPALFLRMLTFYGSGIAALTMSERNPFVRYLWLSMRGYVTVTTKAQLNEVTNAFGLGYSFGSDNNAPYFKGKQLASAGSTVVIRFPTDEFKRRYVDTQPPFLNTEKLSMFEMYYDKDRLVIHDLVDGAL